MYNNGLLKSDFILVSGDVVSNLKLDKVLAAHKFAKTIFFNIVELVEKKINNPS